MRIEHATDIDAPIERVWSLTTDIERWPDLFSTVTEVESLDSGELRVGSRALLRQPAQRPRIWTVTTLSAPHTFEWTARVGWMELTARHVLSETSSGCRNQLMIDLEGPGSAMVGRLLRRQLLTTLEIENDGFRRSAESSARPESMD